MALDRGEPIYLDGNDDAPLLYIDKLDTASPPDRVAATGLTGLTVKLAAAEGGAAINAALSKTLTETPASSGWYLATFEGSDLTAQLATYVNKDVVQIAGDASNVNKQILRQVLLSR
jgi:hypothetical protein